MAKLLLFYAHRGDDVQVTNMLITLFSFWLHVHVCLTDKNGTQAFKFVACQFC